MASFDIYTQRIALVTYTSASYLERAKLTIEGIRKTGQFYGDLVVMTDGQCEIDPRYIRRMNLIVKPFPEVDVSNLLAQIRMHPFQNWDGREYNKPKQWNKIYTFDPYFKQWDFVLFVDAGLRIFDSLEFFYPHFRPGKLVAMDDGHPDFTKKFSCQLELSNEPVVAELKKIFDLEANYFLNCLYLYDTSLITDTTVSDLIELMNRFPISKTNEMGIMNIYFHSVWVPLNIYLRDGRILFDWSERGGRRWDQYVALKYPCTI